jgi:hypothetical protein
MLYHHVACRRDISDDYGVSDVRGKLPQDKDAMTWLMLQLSKAGLCNVACASRKHISAYLALHVVRYQPKRSVQTALNLT